MGTKQTPKSCSCESCKRGKSSVSGKKLMKLDERAYRHGANVQVRKGLEPSSAAPIGNYYD